MATARVRDYLAWEQVRTDLKEQEKDGNVDVARIQTLAINIDKAKGRISDAVKQAYCIVVTVSEKDEVQAFKINVTDEPHFNTVKNDLRSRVQDSPITAEALLPDGPYNLWREGETSRRVKDLSGAFAQLPHLPKMLKAQAILDTLQEGCVQGSFVLRLPRPDGSFRTWWRAAPDETAMNDPALELVLPDAAELAELPYQLLLPGNLPELGKGDEVTVQAVLDYFNGKTVVQIPRDGYMESISIPKTGVDVINKVITAAVEAGALWLVSGPASVLAEPIPAGVLTPKAIVRQPPTMIAAAEILPENLPDAWSGGQASALSIATALSQKFGQTMPWKTVKDVITASINARFAELDGASGDWPCDYPAAQSIKLKVATAAVGGFGGAARGGFTGVVTGSKYRVAAAELEPSEIQDLGDIVPQLLEIKAKANVPIKFRVQIELGDGKEVPPDDVVMQVNKLLGELKDAFSLE